eukprot:TRINITY_DN40496_c0_g1_i1.p1 TRINITY_DN40496_c0_g1~~TRINITY_DN40496_c0_g1_i1.p1  ORF type:complete len:314 (-),score=41.15 TRINITY_DN40496_c0_g1_i1:266-1207(-)
MVKTTYEGDWVLLGGYSDDEVAYPSSRPTVPASPSTVGDTEVQNEVASGQVECAKVGRDTQARHPEPVSPSVAPSPCATSAHKNERTTSDSVSDVSRDENDSSSDDDDDEASVSAPCPPLPKTVCERVESRILGLTRRQFLYLSGTYCAAIYVLALYSLFTTMGALHSLDVTARSGAPTNVNIGLAASTDAERAEPPATASDLVKDRVDKQVEEKETISTKDQAHSRPPSDHDKTLERERESQECYQYYSHIYKDMMWLLHGQSISTDGEIYAGLAFVDPFGDSDWSSFDHVPHSQYEHMLNVLDNLKLCPSR